MYQAQVARRPGKGWEGWELPLPPLEGCLSSDLSTCRQCQRNKRSMATSWHLALVESMWLCGLHGQLLACQLAGCPGCLAGHLAGRPGHLVGCPGSPGHLADCPGYLYRYLHVVACYRLASRFALANSSGSGAPCLYGA